MEVRFLSGAQTDRIKQLPQEELIMQKLKEWTEKLKKSYPRLRFVIGIILIILGLAAFVTPLTPGSWLALIGLELIGVRVLFGISKAIKGQKELPKDA